MDGFWGVSGAPVAYGEGSCVDPVNLNFVPFFVFAKGDFPVSAKAGDARGKSISVFKEVVRSLVGSG